MVGNIPPSSGDTSPIYYNNSNPVNPTDGQSTPSYREQFEAVVRDSSLTRDEKFAKLDALKEELDKQVENLPKDQQTNALSDITAAYTIAKLEIKIAQKVER